MAVKNEHINVIRYLLNNGAAVDEIVTVLEGNILHFAAAECTKLSVFQLLINHPTCSESVINAGNYDGDTPLDYRYTS